MLKFKEFRKEKNCLKKAVRQNYLKLKDVQSKNKIIFASSKKKV